MAISLELIQSARNEKPVEIRLMDFGYEIMLRGGNDWQPHVCESLRELALDFPNRVNNSADSQPELLAFQVRIWSIQCSS